MFRLIFALMVSAALAGCASVSTPTARGDAVKAPAERVLAFQDRNVPNAGTIVVTRDSGLVSGACYYAVAINGVLAARLDVAETVTFHVSAGEVLMRSSFDPLGKGLCTPLNMISTQRETVLKQGEVKSFRLVVDINGNSDIQRWD